MADVSDHPIHPWYGPCDELHDGVCCECVKEIETLRSELATVTRQRDEAIKAGKEFAAQVRSEMT